MLKITRDSNANLKLLKWLERLGLIVITDVLGENETKKVKDKIGPVGVWGHFKWDDGSVWASDDNKYSEICEIIGKNNIQDARKLEAHIRSGNDCFVTEDNDFLSKKDWLKHELGVEVITPQELVKMIEGNLV